MKQIYRFLLYLIPLICFLPIFILRDYTPNNELRYVSIVDEALNNGSIAVFYNHGIPYADKPPLYFWLMMAGRAIAGKHLLFFMGLINLMITACIMLIMNRWCFPNTNIKKRLPPMLVLLTTGLFTGAFLVMRMDILMTLFIVLSLYTFYKLYNGTSSKDDEWLFPIYLFLGIFSKGPIGLLIPVIAIIIFLIINKKLTTIVRYLGWRTWGVMLVLCGIWFATVYHEGGIAYLKNLLFHQTFDRAVNSFHHKEPFYFYILRFWLLAAPWSLFGAATIIRGFRQRLIKEYPIRQFFIVIIFSTFLLLSLVSSKVDIYLLPIYPFFIYFAFMVIDDVKQSKLVRAMIWIPVILLCTALPICLYMEEHLPFTLSYPWLLIIGAILLTIVGGVAIGSLLKGDIIRAITLGSAGIIVFIFLSAFQIPGFNSYLGFGNITKEAQELGRMHKTMRYASLGIGRSENMEVYLNVSVTPFSEWTILTKKEQITRPYILFTTTKIISKNDSLRLWLQNKERRVAGKYEVYTIE